MQWEHLTAPDFAQACRSVKGVCILPMGVLESHGPHLPLGTDLFQAHTIAVEAAKLEPAVVFPGFYFGQLAGAQHIAGNVCLSHELLLRLLDEVCREIARNGFHKILLLNAHGGNVAFVQYFIQSTLQHPKDYVVYGMRAMSDDALKQLSEDRGGGLSRLNEIDRGIVMETAVSDNAGGHAGFIETSFVLGVNKRIVHMDRIHDQDFRNRGRLLELKAAGVLTWNYWYAEYPNNYGADPQGSSEDIGKELIALLAQRAAHAVKLIKEDEETGRLQQEFFAGGEA